MTTVTISMPDSLKAFVDQAVERQGFHNVSDYLQNLLQHAQTEEEDGLLETLLLEGLASGQDIPVDAQFWARVRANVVHAPGRTT